MKIAEIKEIPTNDLVERVEAEVTNYNQMVLNHYLYRFFMLWINIITTSI